MRLPAAVPGTMRKSALERIRYEHKKKITSQKNDGDMKGYR